MSPLWHKEVCQFKDITSLLEEKTRSKLAEQEDGQPLSYEKQVELLKAAPLQDNVQCLHHGSSVSLEFLYARPVFFQRV